MCWWGVVRVERLHRQHGPLVTHPRMCMGHQSRHLWGQANGHLSNPLESQHQGVFCAPRIVPATFWQLVPVTFRQCSGHLFGRPLDKFGSNDLPLFFQAIQLVVDTKQVVYDAHNHPGDVSLGGDSSWVRRIIGISTAPQVGSPYKEAIGDFDAGVWMGKDVVRTTESDHEQRTFFFLGTPSPKAAGCSVDPVVVIARCRVVMCIWQCCMALGRLQMANIEPLANDWLAPGDQVTPAAIQATLHDHRTGCRLGKDLCRPLRS